MKGTGSFKIADLEVAQVSPPFPEKQLAHARSVRLES